MTEIRNIDGLINGLPPMEDKKDASQEENHEHKAENDAEHAENIEQDQEIHEEKAENEEKPDDSVENKAKSEEKSDESAASDEKDEYGNDIPKGRTYTEEEVQRMIRDRLKRGAFREQNQEQPPQHTQQQVQQAQNDGFEHDAESEESWDVQLENFIRKTHEKMTQEQAQRQVHAKEQAVQQEFESKFQTGMAKYPDFVETVSDKPITDAMMMGIRGLDNPAAFLYAASKRAPKELQRIASLPDAYQQVSEMGKLQAKLAKPKRGSSAPAPVSQDRSDIVDKAPAEKSVDQKILDDQKSRFRR